MLAFDLPVMVAVALACLPIFFTGNLIARWEGGLFFAYYLAYTVYLILHASQHAALPTFAAAMAGFFLPLTFATLAVVAWRHWRGAA
jgi:cation:H+ antiporter